MHADALGLRTRKSSQWITRKYNRQASKAAAFGAPIHTATIERVMSRQQVSSDLAQRLDRCDVLTDEPRDIRRMGRDHEMTRARNSHQRRSGNCVTQHLGDALNGWRTAVASDEEAWRSDARIGGKRHIETPLRRPVEKVRRCGGNNLVAGLSREGVKAAVAAVEVDDAPRSQQLSVVTRADIGEPVMHRFAND